MSAAAPALSPEAARVVPAGFLLDGRAEVVNASKGGGSIVAELHLAMPVNEALDLYRTAVVENGYDILVEDNEGFEAELYLERMNAMGALKLMSIDEQRSVVLIHIPARSRHANPSQTGPERESSING